MAEIILGCDKNKAKSDKEHQKTIAKLLEKAGHTVKIMKVGPGALQNEMKKKTSKGKVAVFLVNGADLQTYKDAYVGMKPGGYYHTKYCYFGLQGYINKRTCTCKGAKSVKLKKAHDDKSPASFTKDIVGMTTHEVMEKYKSRIYYTCGASVKELGENLVTLIGGGDPNSSSATSSSKQESNGTSIKEALKQALAPWDGEVEIRLVDDTVYVNKIPNPTDTTLEITEYDNSLYDNVTVTDVDKYAINNVNMTYKKYKLNINDPILIKRFGKNTKKITAPKTVKSLNAAKEYLNLVWKKLLRDNGRQVECKVIGSSKWKIGRWVRVYLPSYFIDGYMYIIKSSHDTDSSNNWTTNLTLVDYPPTFAVESAIDSGTSNDGKTSTDKKKSDSKNKDNDKKSTKKKSTTKKKGAK